ncbi:uncharacterized protein LOC110245536 [Exaiptasia diaphana]|uniref:Uncharacterized protein n=1 Tax=Exaiptasia diaphana TaxID=2652724 RepID=A0A913XP84_EXADI|nr:uncharacterized protein LOC110245536 [Exaiptasia diaphana]
MSLQGKAIFTSRRLFCFAQLGDAAATRRDVFPIAIPLNNKDMKPLNATKNATENNTADKNSDKTLKDKVKHAESYPNPPVPTPAGFSLHQLFNKNTKNQKPKNTQNDNMRVKPTQWGFNDKYLASENRYAVKRDALFDGAGGDSMSFSNFQILGNQDVIGKR